MAKRVAIIDIGSNSVRMVVYERTSRFAFHQLHEEKSKVRLSENAYQDGGKLQVIPMQRTYDALANFIQVSKAFKVKKLFCVATSALRDAPNQKEFLQKVKNNLKLNIKIISGEQEAYYGAIACINLLPKLEQSLSIDIGGGSTELSYLHDNKITDTVSLKLGTVRLKELYFDNNDIEGATQYITQELHKIPDNKITTLVGIGGTFRALATAIMKSDSHPLKKIHAYKFPADTFSQYMDEILVANETQLRNLFIKENRFDVIKPGTLILKLLLKKINISTIITSGVGVREGVYLTDLLRNSKHQLPHNFNTSIKYLLDTYIVDSTYSNNLNTTSKRIFELTKEYLQLDSIYKHELAIAAKLYPIGGNIHFYTQSKQTYSLVQSVLEYGLTHENITLIATLIKYAQKKLPSSTHIQKYTSLLPQPTTVQKLSYLLSLSIALLSHRPRNIDFILEFKDGTLRVITNNNLYITKDAVSKLHYIDDSFKVKFYS